MHLNIWRHFQHLNNSLKKLICHKELKLMWKKQTKNWWENIENKNIKQKTDRKCQQQKH